MKQDSKKLLEQYKNDALAPQDTEGVEQLIIREALRTADRKKWMARLEEEGIERDIASAPETIATPKRTIFRRLTPYAIGLAAALAFLMIFVLRPSQGFDSLIHNNRFQAAEVRMGNNNDPLTWKMAMDAYRNNNFDEAVRLINSLPDPTSEQLFYLALSNMYKETPNYAASAALFQNFVDSKDAVYEEEARWFWAYSLYKLEKRAQSKMILESILRNKGYNYQKAKLILEKEF